MTGDHDLLTPDQFLFLIDLWAADIDHETPTGEPFAHEDFWADAATEWAP